MKDLIRKLIREFEENNFDWVDDAISNNFNLGPYFENSDVCYEHEEEEYRCTINVTKDYFVFKVDFDWWMRKYFNDDSILESLIRYGSYNNDGDEWMDDDEINYVYFYLNQDNREKIKECLSYFGKDIENYDLNSGFGELIDDLNNVKSTDYLVGDIISEINYALNRNRSAKVLDYYENLMEETEFQIEYYRGWRNSEILVKAPNEFVINALSQGYNLSEVFDKINSGMDLDQDWSSIYYEEYDTSGAEEGINKAFDYYLDNLLEKMESDDTLVKLNEFIKSLRKLGFARTGNEWWKTVMDKNSDYVFKITDINPEEMNLVLRITVFSENQTKHKNYKYRISFNELGSYLNNYLLDIE